MSIFYCVCVLIFTMWSLKIYKHCAATLVPSSLLASVLASWRNDVTIASSARTARLKAGGEFFWQRGVGGHSAQHFSFTNLRVHSSFSLRDFHLRRGERTPWTQQVWLAVISYFRIFFFFKPVFSRVAPPVTSAVTIATTTAATPAH